MGNRKIQIAGLFEGGLQEGVIFTPKHTLYKALFISENKNEIDEIKEELKSHLVNVILETKDISEITVKLLQKENYNLIIVDKTSYESVLADMIEAGLEDMLVYINNTRIMFLVEVLITPHTDTLYYVGKIDDSKAMVVKLIQQFPANHLRKKPK